MEMRGNFTKSFKVWLNCYRTLHHQACQSFEELPLNLKLSMYLALEEKTSATVDTAVVDGKGSVVETL